jgi:sialic acid synthase SpsE
MKVSTMYIVREIEKSIEVLKKNNVNMKRSNVDVSPNYFIKTLAKILNKKYGMKVNNNKILEKNSIIIRKKVQGWEFQKKHTKIQ